MSPKINGQIVSLIAFLILLIILPCSSMGQNIISPARSLSCQQCHGSPTLKYIHPPVKDDCLNCHMEHFDEGNERFNLQANGNELCTCCHFDSEEVVGHPVVNHPTYGPQDPWDKRKPFTCLSCHAPHQSNMPNLFRYEYQSTEDEVALFPCVFCHRRAKTRYPLPENPEHIDLLLKNVAK